MAMSEKDFIALADVLRSENFQESIQDAIPERDCITTALIINRVCTVLAQFCASQNSDFNRERWLKYITLR